MAIITQIYVHLFLVVFAAFTSHSSSHAYQLIVGGKDGWVINPSENYNHWAGRLRFQVNDTLLFKYNKGSDSVLVVNNHDYDTCNTANLILRLDDGNSVFKFDRSGPFFFISGNKSNCDKGQKLIIVVLAVRNRRSPPRTPSPSPAEAPSTRPSSSSSTSPPGVQAPAPAASDGDSPDGANAAGHPPPRSHATHACAPSFVLMSTVSFVLSVCLGGFIAAT
ncbi:UNVERIFIED_CONTAM: Early nodulin-like protein 1 [Sesamum angustifolium]|uniref:Early nodulin-like protein 1 n=1 Tax=Sesamum angustifolium TaxID=2727405 RepID=A0AAW2PFK4_9LAMI